MDGLWLYNRFKLGLTMVFAAILMFDYNLSPCWSLNTEGLALLKFRDGVESDPLGVLSGWNDGGEWDDLNPCSWFGVECSDGKVVILNLSNLCLKGPLAPELGKLSNVKSIILRNNSFYGKIPQEIGDLKELEVLDLGYNNFSGPIPADLGNNLSLSILLLDNNNFLDTLSPEVYNLKTLSEFQVNQDQLTSSGNGAGCNGMCTSWNAVQAGDVAQRKLLQASPLPSSPLGSIISSIAVPPSTVSSPSESPSPAEFSVPSPSPVTPPVRVFPAPASPPVASRVPKLHPALPPSSASIPSLSDERSSKPNHHTFLLWSGVVGGSTLLFLSAFGFCICRRSKVVTVKPWATGLSGQLQKAFTTGVPSLQRLELVTACEDFSNIIGSLSDGTVYKGTLSSGVEIAVTSTAVTSAKDWTEVLETQFRNKLDMLSKVNHKNFVNLIGYCEEENPFTRMMVFEYAPNGTLFEHLHIREAEHLDWFTRLRIAMGMAYCLEYLHQLSPPISHVNLQSSSIYLTEDYAAKISDFSFWRNETAVKMRPSKLELLDTSYSSPESNVYSFGVILLEMITGQMPHSVEKGSPDDWASNYLKGVESIKEMVDPTLSSFKEDELEKLFEVVKSCVLLEPSQRPKMREITAKLKEITAMAPDGAMPRMSPLWWAELEILSTESS